MPVTTALPTSIRLIYLFTVILIVLSLFDCLLLLRSVNELNLNQSSMILETVLLLLQLRTQQN